MLWAKLSTCSFTEDNSNRQFVSQFLDTGSNETSKVITNVNEQYLFQRLFARANSQHVVKLYPQLRLHRNTVLRMWKPSTERCTPLIHKDFYFCTGYMIVITCAFINEWKWTALLCFTDGREKPFTSPACLENFNTSRIKKEKKRGIHKHTTHPLHFLCTNVHSNS